MTVANSIISNILIGAYDLLPFPNGSGWACMTIIDSVVSNNNARAESRLKVSFLQRHSPA